MTYAVCTAARSRVKIFSAGPRARAPRVAVAIAAAGVGVGVGGLVAIVELVLTYGQP